ncbi:MAG: twin-arginine translocation signal domain-containing protein [Bryobacterales bacterium]|nr:twin-arginine translocation signal domain-containing protein [Bryobacterales bacterium]
MQLDVLKSSRRDFLRLCGGACAACAACPSAVPAPPAAPEKTRLRVVFTHTPPELPTWPNRGYDYEGRKQEILRRFRQDLPHMEFLPVTALKAEDAQEILARDAEVDGYIWFLVGLGPAVGMTIAQTGRPVVFVDDLYAGSGTFLGNFARARRLGLKVAGVSSSRFEDVVQAARAFDCIKRLKSAVIIDGTEGNPSAEGGAIRDLFGAEVRQVGAEEFNSRYQAADRAEGQRWANQWMKNAQKIVEPTREEIGKSGLMYVAMKDLMARNKADAITIDCLRLLYGGKLPAYPCLGFTQLNNDGLVGACEADLQSTISMLVMTYLTGRPGFISDPVIDTSRNQIIYAHCVAPTKVFGPQGPANPYHIRNHSEDRKGAVVRSLLPLGQMTTTLKFLPQRKEVVIHQGKAVANVDEDKACRTKLAVEGPDTRKLKDEWAWGWHRVTFYGDYRDAVDTFSSLMGIKVLPEG